MNIFGKSAVLALVLPFCATAASATTTTFNTLSTFLAATNAELVETFDSAGSNQFVEGAGYAFNGFTASYEDTSGIQFVGTASAEQINAARGTAINSTTALAWGEYRIFSTGSYFATGDGPMVTLALNSAAHYFGFYFSDSDGTDAYRVSFNGENHTLYSASGRGTGFFGFMTDTAVSSLTFSQVTTGGATETFSIDDIYLPAVPVPASLPLLGGALALLGLRRKRRG